MKWKKIPPGASNFLPEKTFLINRNNTSYQQESTRKLRSKCVSSDTGTWPPKIKKHTSLIIEDLERPQTANLEKPSVLDPKLVDKLDMSLLSKELLCESMIARYHEKHIKSMIGGGTSLSRRRRKPEYSTSSSFKTCNDNKPCVYKSTTFTILSDFPKMQKKSIVFPLDSELNKNQGFFKLNDNNNKDIIDNVNKISPLSLVKKKIPKPIISSDVEVFKNVILNKNAPAEPCRTCGRPDQPERFHSHPKGTIMKTNQPILKTIQKPVAMNFRSDKNKIDQTSSVKSIFEERMKNNDTDYPVRPSSVPIKRRPKTITCYICGREFGSTSFSIHEPKCIQKFERENNDLPVHLRRALPSRPEIDINSKDWNEAAWEKSQAQLLPCSKCGRTFVPDRLPIHEKSCKFVSKDKKEFTTTINGPSSMIACRICGRNFGTRSIKIHEPQCIRRCREMENKTTPNQYKNKALGWQSGRNVIGDVPQKKTITCYICGRDFGSHSINIHEPQCLKKWQIENEKLPLGQRRAEPVKPEVCTDNEATSEANWKSHLKQLVPCKNCGRTFNPDRVNVHEKSCKGI